MLMRYKCAFTSIEFLSEAGINTLQTQNFNQCTRTFYFLSKPDYIQKSNLSRPVFAITLMLNEVNVFTRSDFVLMQVLAVK